MNNIKFLEKWKWYILAFDTIAAIILFIIAIQTKESKYIFSGFGFLFFSVASFFHPTSPFTTFPEAIKKGKSNNPSSVVFFIIGNIMFLIALERYLSN